MTPRQQFERAIGRITYPAYKYTPLELVWSDRVLQIMLAEHRRVVRLVQRRITEVERGSQCQENVSYRLALTDLLAALKGGKP
jgi:hypothetical protein